MRSSSIASLVLLAACARSGSGPATETPPAPPAPSAAKARFTIDESRLPPSIHFAAADLDAGRAACDDFDGHVNGKWLAANEIPGDMTSWGAFEGLFERSLGVQRQLAEQAAALPDAAGVEKIVGDLYATALDEAKINAQGLTPLAGELAAIDALKDRAAVVEFLRQAHAAGDDLVFSFGPDSDFAAPDMTFGYAVQGGLGLPDKAYYVDADKKDELAAYEAHVAKVLALSGIPAKQAAAQARTVVAMETRLAKASRSQEEISRDVSLYYNPVTLAEADKLTPAFSWTRYFESQGVAPERFSLAMPAFHQSVSALLADAPLAHWKSYLRFHVVDRASPYLADPFVDERFAFYSKTLRGQKEMRPRWKRALGAIETHAGEALGQLYVQVAFPPEAKARMEELVRNLSAALKVRLAALAWMSPETKRKAMEKWATFKPKIGYPDKWRDWTGLVTSRESLLGNVNAARAFNRKWDLSKIGKPIDRAEWSLSPQTVNASYNPLLNEITFPAAILQPPFFDPKADDALNYGGIGAGIGHEMIHGYDDQGSRFGPSGKFENWWTPADAKGFAERTARLVTQFDAYEVSPGKKVSGNLTLGENIADLGGLAVAFDALGRAAGNSPDPKLEGLTREQRFFANWGTVWRRAYRPEELAVRLVSDPHAPSQFRAIGAPSNLEAFAKAFGCKPGTRMRRAERIAIW